MTPFPQELSAAQLRRNCAAEDMQFDTTAEVETLKGIIGQERATRAIEFGLEIEAEGYNIFAMGPSGAGKTTTILRYLRESAASRSTPNDWAYVRNPNDPYRPRALALPPGKGRLASQKLRDTLKQAETNLREAFSGSMFEEAQTNILKRTQRSQQQVLQELDSFAHKHNFALQQTPTGLTFIPLHKGKPLTAEAFAALDEKTRKQYAEAEPTVQQAMEQAIRELQKLQEAAGEKIKQLHREVVQNAISPLFQALEESYADYEDFVAYTQEVAEDIAVRAMEGRLPFLQQKEAAEKTPAPSRSMFPRPWTHDYELNLIVDNAQTKGAPVIYEINPTLMNLIGKVEYRAEFGTLVPDHHTIRPGALHLANGGYLVINAEALLKSSMAWEALTRSLRHKEVRIEEPAALAGAIPAASLAPVPIPLDIKVVMIGTPATYFTLWSLDATFAKLFKVRADFASDMDWNTQNMLKVAQFIRTRGEEENLLPFSLDAVAEVVEFGGRLVESQDRLTTRFAIVADIVREADYWARKDDNKIVQRHHVQKAIQERRYRSSLYEETLRRNILEGTIMVDTRGSKVAQVNGLAVIEMGDYAFAKPSRITASTYLGSKGIINIERESRMSGRIHDKGVLILAGYLGRVFGQDKPLNLNASIAFEQSYEGVDGDSASSTELYALLSSVANLPLKQNIAVTGSVNQWGEIQAVGGVTLKIEGFFDVCQAQGLTGDQGVMIPAANVRHLMLRDDVVAAVAEGKFHIWPIKHVNEGFSLLCGLPDGERDSEGRFPEGTWNRLVDDRLREMALAYAQFARKSQNNQNKQQDQQDQEKAEEENNE